MIDPSVWNFAVVACVIVGGLGGISFIATQTWRAVRRTRRAETLQQPRHDEQLAQLQQSMDAIAVEVERIAEAQRFSTRLLADGLRTSSIGEEK